METTQVETQPPAPAPETPKVKTSYGALGGLLVVVAAIVFGALYFLQERVGSSVQIEQIQEQGTSTDAASIEEDLNAQSPDEFEKDLDKAFVDLDAAFESQ
jgi:uncharacterized protein HemX